MSGLQASGTLLVHVVQAAKNYTLIYSVVRKSLCKLACSVSLQELPALAQADEQLLPGSAIILNAVSLAEVVALTTTTTSETSVEVAVTVNFPSYESKAIGVLAVVSSVDPINALVSA